MLAVGAGRLSMPSLSVANSLTLCCYQACFTGGMLALGAKHAPTPELEQWYLEVGIQSLCGRSGSLPLCLRVLP